MYYGISSRDYLLRVKKRLGENKPESLFYAAFELRCGIESRMQDSLKSRVGQVGIQRILEVNYINNLPNNAIKTN